MISLKLM